MKKYYNQEFSNGDEGFKLSWINQDEILIKTRYGKPKVIDGGDFESFINALTFIKDYEGEIKNDIL